MSKAWPSFKAPGQDPLGFSCSHRSCAQPVHRSPSPRLAGSLHPADCLAAASTLVLQ